LNGRPVFLRGTLECCIFPRTGYPPTDVPSWERILKVAKAHGLNHLRFHSWCPPEAAFEAADRMGFIYQIECDVWTTIGTDPKVDAFIHAETERILRTYGNHPSFCLLSHGNEPSGQQKEFLTDWLARCKKLDSRHLYTAGSGWPRLPESQYHVTPDPRIQAWGAGLSSRVNAKPPETTTDYRSIVAQNPTQPIISHEIGQWCVYPNLEEIAKYTGVTRARNFEVFRDFLQSSHLLDQAKPFLLASGKLQAMLYKEEIESALRTPGFGGFQLLDLHDFPGQGTALVGVLDPFWESKGYITAEEFHRFCCETVPLARLTKRTWTSDETFTAQVEVAHFGPRPMASVKPSWTLTGEDGKVVASGTLPVKNVPLGNGIALGEIRADLSKAQAPQKLVLTVAIGAVTSAKYSNDWDLWVYPPKAAQPEPKDVVLVDRLDEKALASLRSGGKVLLLPRPGSVRGDERGRVPPGFSSIFWNTAWTRGQAPHTLGVLFPTEYHSNWQWWDLVSKSQILILKDLPPDFRPIVQVIDDWFTARRLGLVFEANVEGGRLLVCGIDLRTDLDQRPVARQMRQSLTAYMQSAAFAPKHTLTPAQLASLFTEPRQIEQLGAKVVRTSSEATGYEGNQAIDGNPATCWHTAWEPEVRKHPHEIVIDLGQAATLKGIAYLPRQDMNNGWIREYAVYLGDDSRQWGEPAAKGTFPKDSKEQRVVFAKPQKGRYLRLVALSGFDNQPWAAIGELDVILVSNP
jgi:hypothetical protein